MQSIPEFIRKEILSRFLDDYVSNSPQFEHDTVSEETIGEFTVVTKVSVRESVGLFVSEISTEDRGPQLVGACLTREEAEDMHQSVVSLVAQHLEQHG